MSARPLIPLASALGILAVAGAASPAYAQVRGGVQVITNGHTFSTSGQPMWGTPVEISEGIDLFFDTGDQSGSFAAAVGDEPFKFGISGTGGIRAVFGLQASVAITGGQIGVVFPMTLEIRAPEANSFRPGEEIMLTTGWSPADGAAITTVAPSATFDVNSPFGVEATSLDSLCVFDCFQIADITVGFPEGLRASAAPGNIVEELLLYQVNAVTQKVNVPVLLPQPASLPYELDDDVLAQLIGLSGRLDLPRAKLPCPSDVVYLCVQFMHDGALLASANHDFVELGIDLDTWLILAIAKVKPATGNVSLGVSVPFDEFPFNLAPDGSRASVDLFDGDFNLVSRETQNFRFTPNAGVTLTFARAVSYRVVDGGTQVAAGSGTTVPFRVGQTLFLTFPTGTSPLGVSSSYDLAANRFENRTSFNLSGSATFKALDYDIHIPDKITESGTVWERHFPAFSESFELPVVEQTLTGFGSTAGTSFTLDPEDPCIRVRTALEPGLVNGLGPAGTLVQTIRVRNCGDVRVLMTQVMDALNVAFPDLPGFSVTGVSSADLATNAAWNGSGSTLAGTDVLEPGQISFITVVFAAEPGNIYGTTVVASGQSPIETPLVDTDAGSFAVYPVNFDIDKLNNAGGPNAIVPLHILNTPALDIQTIDPATLRIDGLVPENWTYVLRDNKGPETDLAAFFNRQALWDLLQARRASAVALNVSGRTGRLALSEREIQQLADAVLSGVATSDGIVARADRLGNSNGRLDLGDLRAATQHRLGAEVAQVADDGVAVTLPLTGTLLDGTPFVAEDAIIIP